VKNSGARSGLCPLKNRAIRSRTSSTPGCCMTSFLSMGRNGGLPVEASSGRRPRRSSAKSSDTSLSTCTTRNGPKLVGGCRPGMSTRKAADAFLSRTLTIVWFKCTGTEILLGSYYTGSVIRTIVTTLLPLTTPLWPNRKLPDRHRNAGRTPVGTVSALPGITGLFRNASVIVGPCISGM
jgi:hypothetical protein